MDLDDHIAEEWRDLGFWYDRTEESGWELRGSATGLRRFVAALRLYAAHPANAMLSEHEHFGPYFYLEVCTGDHAEVNGHCVLGTQADIARLADLLETWLRRAAVGDRNDFAREY